MARRAEYLDAGSLTALSFRALCWERRLAEPAGTGHGLSPRQLGSFSCWVQKGGSPAVSEDGWLTLWNHNGFSVASKTLKQSCQVAVACVRCKSVSPAYVADGGLP